ncbi:hypothetical protein V5799_033024 [Amblyomma americanum]|uniref:Uncharacterized protein n=1 Tax=Amblyomma americanum TaxID=6943 RepID=A0AAQ4DPH7_AMBAM
MSSSPSPLYIYAGFLPVSFFLFCEIKPLFLFFKIGLLPLEFNGKPVFTRKVTHRQAERMWLGKSLYYKQDGYLSGHLGQGGGPRQASGGR